MRINELHKIRLTIEKNNKKHSIENLECYAMSLEFLLSLPPFVPAPDKVYFEGDEIFLEYAINNSTAKISFLGRNIKIDCEDMPSLKTISMRSSQHAIDKFIEWARVQLKIPVELL